MKIKVDIAVWFKLDIDMESNSSEDMDDLIRNTIYKLHSERIKELGQVTYIDYDNMSYEEI